MSLIFLGFLFIEKLLCLLLDDLFLDDHLSLNDLLLVILLNNLLLSVHDGILSCMDDLLLNDLVRCGLINLQFLRPLH